jgi:hypothetical protein
MEKYGASINSGVLWLWLSSKKHAHMTIQDTSEIGIILLTLLVRYLQPGPLVLNRMSGQEVLSLMFRLEFF